MAGLSTVLLDRTFAFYTSFLLGVAAVIWIACSGEGMTGPVLQMGAISTLCVSGVTPAFLAFRAGSMRDRVVGIVPERFRAPLGDVWKASRARGGSLLFCLALSLIVGVMSMGVFRIAGHVIGNPLGWKQVFMVCPFVFVAIALPISPSGIGMGETAASVVFAQFGVETGATIMLVVRFWFFPLRLPGALFYVFRGVR